MAGDGGRAHLLGVVPPARLLLRMRARLCDLVVEEAVGLVLVLVQLLLVIRA